MSDLSNYLSQAATLSTAVGRIAITAATNALESLLYPAFALGHTGLMIQMNASVEAILGDDIQLRLERLWLRDQKAQTLLSAELSRLTLAPDFKQPQAPPIVCKRSDDNSLMLRFIPIPPSAKVPFVGAKALVTIVALATSNTPSLPVLRLAFGLTVAEARLAQLIASGMTIELAAQELEISIQTVRNQLKAIFAKTGAHRQAELVALLLRTSRL